MGTWLTERGFSQGAVVAPQTLYDLGADWYATRLDVDWRPATASEAQALFDEHGLRGDFWSLD